jgi:hypothetical protein
MFDLQTIPFSEAEILLTEIDWRDEAFHITYGRPLEPLRRSIRAVGLQETPVLQPLPSGRFRIVAGRRRLLILKDQAAGSCPVRLAAADQSAAELLLFGLFDNLGNREFNVVEQSLALSRLAQIFPEEALVRDYLPLLGLPPHRSVLRRYAFLAEVSPHFRPAFVQGRLFPETLDLLSQDFRPWTELLLTLCLSLHFGFQKQKELLEGLREIVLRRSLGLDAVFRGTGLLDLLRRETWPPPQKGEAWRRNLRAELYPALTATERAFVEQVQGLALDARTRIKPPPFFEGGRYELTVQFSTRSDLEDSLGKVRQALEAGKLDDLP